VQKVDHTYEAYEVIDNQKIDNTKVGVRNKKVNFFNNSAKNQYFSKRFSPSCASNRWASIAIQKLKKIDNRFLSIF